MIEARITVYDACIEFLDEFGCTMEETSSAQQLKRRIERIKQEFIRVAEMNGADLGDLLNE
jgi:hypothetical protein